MLALQLNKENICNNLGKYKSDLFMLGSVQNATNVKATKKIILMKKILYLTAFLSIFLSFACKNKYAGFNMVYRKDLPKAIPTGASTDRKSTRLNSSHVD